MWGRRLVSTSGAVALPLQRRCNSIIRYSAAPPTITAAAATVRNAIAIRRFITTNRFVHSSESKPTAESTAAATANAKPEESKTATANAGSGASDGGGESESESGSGSEQPLSRTRKILGWILFGAMGLCGGYAASIILYFPEPCTVALSTASSDERVIKAVGTPLSPIWPWRWGGDSGTGHLTAHAGFAAISIPFTAPRGRGEITARLTLNTKTGKWERMAFVVSGVGVADANQSSGDNFYFELDSDLAVPLARPPPSAHPIAPHPIGAGGDALAVSRTAPSHDAWIEAHNAALRAHGRIASEPSDIDATAALEQLAASNNKSVKHSAASAVAAPQSNKPAAPAAPPSANAKPAS